MSGTVLVTGAAGYIGTVLRGGLPERGWSVRCLDVVPIVDTPPGEEHIVAAAPGPGGRPRAAAPAALAARLAAAPGAEPGVPLAGPAGEHTWPVIRRTH